MASRTSLVPLVPEPLTAVHELPGYSTALFDDGITWTLWLDRSLKCVSASEFTASLRKIYSISSMQALLTVCENILPVSELNNRYSYHFMLGQRRPVWEDPENGNGGTWSFRCAKSDTEFIWRTLLESIITGRLNYTVASGDKLVGLSVGVREAEDVVHIWNVDANKARSASLINAVVTLLPQITFRNAVYKPFKEKTQTQTTKKEFVTTRTVPNVMNKKKGAKTSSKPQIAQEAQTKGVFLKASMKTSEKSSLKPQKSVSFSALVEARLDGHGDSFENSNSNKATKKFNTGSNKDLPARIPLTSRYQNEASY